MKTLDECIELVRSWSEEFNPDIQAEDLEELEESLKAVRTIIALERKLHYDDLLAKAVKEQRDENTG